MRIVIAINTSWNIYNFRMGLIQSLQGEGHEVIAVAPTDNYTEKLRLAGCKFYPIEIQNKGSNPFIDLLLIRKFYTTYKKIQPDIILQFTIKPNIYGTFAAKLLGVPVINTVSGLGTVFLHDNMVSKMALLLYKLSFRFASKVIFQNKSDLKLFLDKQIVQPNQTALTPGSGVNLHKFLPIQFSRNKSFTFLMIARLLFDKGILEYIKAVEILKSKNINARYQLVGALDTESKLGIGEKKLKEWVEENVIEYLGVSDDIQSLISGSDCVVLPSYREGTSKTLLEAAAMGKPLIASAVPGCVEIVEHEVNGYLCKVKDAHDLADRMQQMAELPDLTLQNMSKASREKVQREFDEEKVIGIYNEQINLLTDKKVNNRK